jgi:WXG100 family type VII secretion target
MTVVGANGAFGVTPQDIAFAATSVDNMAGTIADQLATIRSYVSELEAAWKGIAASTFSSLMTDYDVFAQMLNQALTDIAGGLKGNYANYSRSEAQNISNLKTVGGSIPGADFA